MKKVKTAVVGASGYTGQELLRILLRHSGVELVCATSRQYAGQRVSDLFPRFRHVPGADLEFTDSDVAAIAATGAEAAFLALPHGVSASYGRGLVEAGIRVIDLSADFRLNDPAVYEEFYGKPHPDVELLQRLPERILVIGGNLNHPALDGYRKLDLLRQEAYLAENAALTADCALRIAGQELDIAFSEAKAVIIGWGRIAKCLAPMLRDLGAQVTVAARKESDRAMARSLRLRAAAVEELPALAQETDLLINTAPAPILAEQQLDSWHAMKLDLASQKGLDCEDVLWARGLPGKMVSASSGALIARTILEVDAP